MSTKIDFSSEYESEEKTSTSFTLLLYISLSLIPPLSSFPLLYNTMS